jgi:hypothetical protein
MSTNPSMPTKLSANHLNNDTFFHVYVLPPTCYVHFVCNPQKIVDAWAEEDTNVALSTRARTGTLPKGRTTKKTQAVGYTPTAVSALRQVSSSSGPTVHAFQSYNPSVEDYKVRQDVEHTVNMPHYHHYCRLIAK